MIYFLIAAAIVVVGLGLHTTVSYDPKFDKETEHRDFGINTFGEDGYGELFYHAGENLIKCDDLLPGGTAYHAPYDD